MVKVAYLDCVSTSNTPITQLIIGIDKQEGQLPSTLNRRTYATNSLHTCMAITHLVQPSELAIYNLVRNNHLS